MSDLRDLYQEVILEHARKPRNFRKIESEGRRVAEGYNRLCGDRLHVYVTVADGLVQDASFEGSGCAISTASASMMTQAVKGKTEAEARALFQRFHHLVTEGAAAPDEAALGKLVIFSGVHEFPARVKCASLAWHTLQAALDRDTDAVVSTED